MVMLEVQVQQVEQEEQELLDMMVVQGQRLTDKVRMLQVMQGVGEEQDTNQEEPNTAELVAQG